ncbi:MAG: carboxymuconolactone decarboxylase family protein [Sphingomonadaceae bacterium]|nr:carboxymuconolactone decarboxylase family protein [Sphingomonadaceae bacterium]
MANIDVPADYAETPLDYAINVLSPEQAGAMFEFSRKVYAGSILPFREFELARALIAQINGCLACQRFRGETDIPDYLEASGVDASHAVHRNGPGLVEQDYAEVREWRTSHSYSARERLALEFAERFSLEPDPLGTDAAFWETLRAHFSDKEICELALAVANLVGSGRFAHVMGFDRTVCPVGDSFAAVERAPAIAAE